MSLATIVAFHAHPDDEALLTGGTLARAARLGHRVVLVVATDGEAGLAAAPVAAQGLGSLRPVELEAAAQALGCARVVRLGLPDSGWHPGVQPPEGRFSRLPLEVAAAGLVDVLRQEHAQVLTTYDAAGGYGHPDHIAVHHVGRYAAEQAGTPAVLQATAPREMLRRIVRIAAKVPGVLDVSDARRFDVAFSPAASITHRVDVRADLDAKIAALAAHASQATSDAGPRTLRLMLGLPRPLQRLVLGREWFVGPPLTVQTCADVFSAR